MAARKRAPQGTGNLFVSPPPDVTKLNVPTELVDLSTTPVVSERVLRIVAPPPPPEAAPYPAESEDTWPVSIDRSHMPGHYWLSFRRGGSARAYASVLVDGEQLRSLVDLATETLEREER